MIVLVTIQMVLFKKSNYNAFKNLLLNVSTIQNSNQSSNIISIINRTIRFKYYLLEDKITSLHDRNYETWPLNNIL